MKLERAQELYSDYAEDALTPALRLALEQHFDADPAARADYDRFARMYSLMERPGEEVEVPLGFRARILEKVAQEQAKRDTGFSSRVDGHVRRLVQSGPAPPGDGRDLRGAGGGGDRRVLWSCIQGRSDVRIGQRPRPCRPLPP